MLDIVYGVVVGIGISQIPVAFRDAFAREESGSPLVPIFVLAAVLFTVLYWLETSRFMDEQNEFERAISDIRGIPKKDRESPLPLTLFFAGGVGMAALAAGHLTFASEGDFVWFAATGALFWLLEIGGSMGLQKSYKANNSELESLRNSSPVAYNWYLRHMASRFPYIYGAFNVTAFVGLAAVFCCFTAAWLLWLTACITLLVTAIRHLYARKALFEVGKRMAERRLNPLAKQERRFRA